MGLLLHCRFLRALNCINCPGRFLTSLIERLFYTELVCFVDQLVGRSNNELSECVCMLDMIHLNSPES